MNPVSDLHDTRIETGTRKMESIYGDGSGACVMGNRCNKADLCTGT